jgi:hypothetical protein
MNTPRDWSFIPPPRPDLGCLMRRVHASWIYRKSLFAGLRMLRPDCELYQRERRELSRWTWYTRRDLAALRFQKDNPPPK